MGIDRVVSEVDVQRGWADVFDVPLSSVAVTPDWGDLDRWGGPEVRVAVARFEAAGDDFPLTLSVVLRDDQLVMLVATDEGSIGAVQRFCTVLACRAIMASEADDQSSWTLVSPTERFRVRGFDPDQDGDRLADAIIEPLAVVAA